MGVVNDEKSRLTRLFVGAKGSSALSFAALVLSLVVLLISLRVSLSDSLSNSDLVVDVGDVVFGAAETLSVKLQNHADAEVSILSIDDCCSFNEVTPLPITLGPNEATDFVFRWKCVIEDPGRFVQSAPLLATDGQSRHVTVKGNVSPFGSKTPNGPAVLPTTTGSRPPPLSAPPIVDLGVVASNGVASETIRISSDQDAHIEIDSIRTSCDCVTVSVSDPIIQSQSHTFAVVRCDLRESGFSGEVRVDVAGIDRDGNKLFAFDVIFSAVAPRSLPDTAILESERKRPR